MQADARAQPMRLQAHKGSQAEEQVVELPPCAAALGLFDAAVLLDLPVVRLDAPALVFQFVALLGAARR